MWIHVPHEGDQTYFFKYYTRNDIYYFYVSDFIEIWELILSKIELCSLIQENNPLIEADNPSLAKYCFEKLYDTSQKSTGTLLEIAKLTGKDIVLNIKVLKDKKFPFKINLKLKSSSPLKFFEEVTLPLITSFKMLKESENHLIKTVLKKDVEIQEYKSDGAVISLKHLKTDAFSELEHRQIFTPSRECFLNSDDVVSILKHITEKESSSDISIKKVYDEKLDTTVIQYPSGELYADAARCNKKPKLDCDNIKYELKNKFPESTEIIENKEILLPPVVQSVQAKRKPKKLLNL